MTATTRHATKPATNWRADAACARVDPELFHPTGQPRTVLRRVKQAKAICRGCPVRLDCLRWALDTKEDSGVLGGLSEEERMELHGRRPRRRKVGELPVLEHILTNRLGEFEELHGNGLDALQIADALGTNVQTVNRVMDRLAADDATAQERVNAA
jgi:WhiB family redox-sensing transcriptional regulator